MTISRKTWWLSALFICMPLLAQNPLATQSPHGSLELACGTCHTPDSWNTIKPDSFDHAQTGFPLVAGHLNRDCKTCHETLVFGEIGTDCIDCHTDIHRTQLGGDCVTCHDSVSWDNRIPMIAHHQTTLFPLVGVHAAASCESCHTNQQRHEYSSVPIDCQGCHLEEFQQTLEPNHTLAGFSTDCQACHQVTDISWELGRFVHPSSFQLLGGHIDLSCSDCHAQTFVGTPSDCVACHEADFVSAQDPNHLTAGFSRDCMSCHNVTAWMPAPGFDHNQTQFPLTGAHVPLDCMSCHEQGFTGTPTDCIACHEQEFNTVQDPNHVALGFPTDCLVCHTTVGWEPASFDHNQTQFPLTGAHVPLDCMSCHEQGFTGTPTDCIACHEQEFNTVQDPNHVALGFPTDCLVCHTTVGWEPASFDHNQTQFPLTGAHVPLDCMSCHEQGFTGTPTDCIACHEQEFNTVQDPNHVALGFPTDCLVCHTTVGWEPASFDHSQTQFPLTGAHVPLDCMSCHDQGFAGTPTDCIACHDQEFNTVQDPNHVALGFPTDCLVCHTTVGWEPASFDHNQTQFPLTGAHVPLDCMSCHDQGFAGTPTDCIACHEQEFNTVQDPNHVALGFPTDCLVCHTTVGWEPASFDHNQTQFPLTGAHVPLDCMSCHEQGFTGTPTDCIACHEQEFNTVQDPNHVALGFPTDCLVCHTTVGWEPASFDHNQTQFPLTGAHVPLDCMSCHEQGFTGTPTDCIACHEQEFNTVQDPNHVALGFPTDCLVCHTTVGWEPASFDHSQTQFPLTGAHVPLDCMSCHEQGFTGTPTDCIACHDQEFNTVQDPNHVALGFPTDCLVCHTTVGWEPASFDHNQTQFPLTGAHVPLDCMSCHDQGFAGTPTDCIACHEQEFNTVQDPNHVALGFPTDCLVCHTTVGWEPASFDHNQTQFPLTGAHVPLDCMSCHDQGFAGTPTDCIACHEQEFNTVQDPNHVALGFPTDCLVCHTTVGWEPASFDHNQTQFPLTGAHAPLDCLSCHQQGFAGTPTDCIACHQQDFNNADDPNHVAQGFPTDCLVCHTTIGWEPSVFNHSRTAFPLTGEHLTLDCLDCHQQGFVGTPTDCFACHQKDYLDADDPDHVAKGFPTDCSQCHNTVDWD